MRNSDNWKPTKFSFNYQENKWEPSSDPRYLNPASQIAGMAAISHYSELIKSHARGHLLDFGCGLAPLYGIYQPYVTDITCADWGEGTPSSPYLDVEADLSGILPFPDSTFDTVLSTDVFEHLPNPSLSLKEVFRILNPGGTLIGGTPFIYWVHAHPHDYYRYTRYGLTHLFSEAGFKSIKVFPMAGGLETAADFILKLCGMTPGGNKTAVKLLSELRSLTEQPISQEEHYAINELFALSYGFSAVKE